MNNGSTNSSGLAQRRSWTASSGGLNRMLISLTNVFSKALCSTGAAPYLRGGHDVRIVHYHGIGDGKRRGIQYLQDEIRLDHFEYHLDYMQRRYEIVTLDSLVEMGPGEAYGDRPRLVITFDDGLASVYREAFPALERRRLPFTVFLSTAVIDNGGLLMQHALGVLLHHLGFDELLDLVERHVHSDVAEKFTVSSADGLETWLRRHASYVLDRKLLEAVANDVSIDLTREAKSLGLYLSWRQIETMRERGGSFYSHTHGHHPLGHLGSKALVVKEFTDALEVMRSNECTDTTFVSFPFGMPTDYGPDAIQAALSAGHRYVVEVGDGINDPARMQDQHVLSRVGLGNVSTDDCHLYAALELRPVVKHCLRRALSRLPAALVRRGREDFRR